MLRPVGAGVATLFRQTAGLRQSVSSGGVSNELHATQAEKQTIAAATFGASDRMKCVCVRAGAVGRDLPSHSFGAIPGRRRGVSSERFRRHGQGMYTAARPVIAT
jgi:hypothetical protein